MAEIRGVFFDLGGTLRIAKKAPEHQARARDRMAYLAGERDAAAFLARVDARYKTYRAWALTENRESGDYELWAKWLLPELGREHLRDICHEMTYQYRQVSGLREMVEGGRLVLDTLRARGYRLGIVSNLIGENEIFDWLRDDGLSSYFSAVQLSSVCHIRKPDPEIFSKACEEMGLAPAQCASVADKPDRDILGAKRAGIGVNILFICPEKLARKPIDESCRPDYIIKAFPEILTLAPLKGAVP